MWNCRWRKSTSSRTLIRKHKHGLKSVTALHHLCWPALCFLIDTCGELMLMGRNKARASKRLVCERRRVNSAELRRCCLAGSSESVKTPAPSLISIGLCHRSERKARLLPSLASDSHLATYFKPLFSHHRKATKQMVFTSKAVLPQGRGLGS